MNNSVFTGAGVAIITPMNDDMTVNFEELGRIIDDQIAGSTDAIIICGTTGESATLTDSEHREVIRYAIEKTAGRIPVIAGTGSNDTSYAISLSVAAEQMGADGLLLVTPYYNKCTQKGLVEHFYAVADAVNIPIIVYSVASRTGVNINPETALELSKHKNIVGIKEASGNISQVAKIAELCGEDFAIYSGNDDQIVPVLSLGGQGVISVLSNVAPKVAHDICELFFEGKCAQAAKLQLEYLRLCNDLFIEVNPIPVKEAMALMGYNVGRCRMPLSVMEEANKQRLIETLKHYSII